MYDEDSLNMSGYSIEDIYIGMKKSVTKTISESDVYTYAGLIGDFNPVHEVIPAKKILKMRTTVTNQRGELVVDGEAAVMVTKPQVEE